MRGKYEHRVSGRIYGTIFGGERAKDEPNIIATAVASMEERVRNDDPEAFKRFVEAIGGSICCKTRRSYSKTCGSF